MPTQVQIRGGTTAQTAVFTGAARELTVDTTKKTVVVHDGATVGGLPLAREDMANVPAIPQNKGGTGGTDPASARAAMGIPDGVGKNKLINPNFAINQRAVAGTVILAANAYGHDRFKAGAGGCTYTFATALNVTTITISAGTLLQVIEGVNLFSGTHVLSWVGNATARVDAGAYGVSGTTGIAVGGTNQSVEWGAGTFSKVQYEAGSVATTFEQRLLAQELALCQRYFESFPAGTLDFIGNNYQAGQNNSYQVPLKVVKRAAPSVNITWSYFNASTAITQLVTAESVVIGVTNTTAGQWRLTSNALGFVSAEL